MNCRFGILVICLAATGSVCAQNNDPFSDPRAVPSRNVRVEIRDKLDISVGIPGTLRTVAELGQKISKGQVVVKLDDRLIQAQYEEARAKAESDVLIRFAEIKRDTAEIDLQEKLDANKETDSQLFTVSEIRRARLEFRQGEAEVEKAIHDQLVAKLAQESKAAELAQFQIASEIDGVVTDVEHPAGESVRQGDPILTITNTDVLRAVLDVDQKYEYRFKVGDKVYVRIRDGISRAASGRTGQRSPLPFTISKEAEEDQSSNVVESDSGSAKGMIFQGEIILISPELEGADRALVVTADIQNRTDSDGRYLLKDGQSVYAVIIGE